MRIGVRFVLGVLAVLIICAQTNAAESAAEATLTATNGKVRYLPRDQKDETVAVAGLPLYARDRIHTYEYSAAVVWLNRRGTAVELGELSTLEIVSPASQTSPLLSLLRGALYFFSRDKPREVQVQTPHATGAPIGTEFVLLVDDDRTLLAVYNGEATLYNQAGEVTLKNGEVGSARAGEAPVKAAIEAENLVQWWLYYPGVLDAGELPFTPAERRQLEVSLQAYRAGDLPGALAAYPGYPSPEPPSSDASRIYLAGLMLAVGQVDKCQSLLDRLANQSSLAEALRWVIAAVQGKLDKPPKVITSASEWLGLSYYQQARHELEDALKSARKAVELSPEFGFGWERVAELEFSFGRVHKAKDALARSLKFAPRNAQAHALRGFLYSAENRKQAREAFEESLRLDSRLGNAWLGRGLVRIHGGDMAGGRMDLQTGALLESKRSLFHSYLGKAFQESREPRSEERR